MTSSCNTARSRGIVLWVDEGRWRPEKKGRIAQADQLRHRATCPIPHSDRPDRCGGGDAGGEHDDRRRKLGRGDGYRETEGGLAVVILLMSRADWRKMPRMLNWGIVLNEYPRSATQNDTGVRRQWILAARHSSGHVRRDRSAVGSESELRRVQMQSLNWLLDLVKRAGVERIVIDGSFVTDIFEPNDVDCVLLIDPDHPYDSAALDAIAAGLPFLDVQLVEREDFKMLVDEFFATDRLATPKGLIEVI